jgi:hypothetical protein
MARSALRSDEDASVIGDQEFAFDDLVINSHAYRQAFFSAQRQSKQLDYKAVPEEPANSARFSEGTGSGDAVNPAGADISFVNRASNIPSPSSRNPKRLSFFQGLFKISLRGGKHHSRKSLVAISYPPTHDDGRFASGPTAPNVLPSSITSTGIGNGEKIHDTSLEDPGPSAQRLESEKSAEVASTLDDTEVTGVNSNNYIRDELLRKPARADELTDPVDQKKKEAKPNTETRPLSVSVQNHDNTESREEQNLSQPQSSTVYVMDISIPDETIQSRAVTPLAASDQNESRLISREKNEHTSRTSGVSSTMYTPSSPSSIETAEWDTILPSKVTCSLMITLDDQTLALQPDPVIIPWQKMAAFEIIAEAAEKSLRHSTKLKDATRGKADYYLRSGSFKIAGEKNQSRPFRLESDLQAVESFVIAISGFVHDYPYEPFRVEINWDYSTIWLPKVIDTKYHEFVKQEIFRKMKLNYKGKAYVPRTDLIRILSQETTQQIIMQDKTIPDSDKAAFAEQVLKHAQILQALCVYSGLPMLCLKKPMEANFTDQNRPIGQHCCSVAAGHRWDVGFEYLLRNRWSFFPYKFPKPDENAPLHDEIDENIVVPVLFKATDDADGESDAIGAGAFSIVYKAKIDPVHHYFTAVSLRSRCR